MNNGTDVAVKMKTNPSSDQAKYLAREKTLVTDLVSFIETKKHPHVIRFVDLYALRAANDEVGLVGLAMPWYKYTLKDWLLRHEEQLDIADVCRMSLHLAQTLKYAHSHSIIHGDIKPENILLHSLAQKALPVICDWAFSKKLSDPHHSSTDLMGKTRRYAPPENRLSGRFDVFSLGIVILIMIRMTKTTLNQATKEIDALISWGWSGDSERRCWTKHSLFNLSTNYVTTQNGFSEHWKVLLTSMLNVRKANRPTMSEVVRALLDIFEQATAINAAPFKCTCADISDAMLGEAASEADGLLENMEIGCDESSEGVNGVVSSAESKESDPDAVVYSDDSGSEESGDYAIEEVASSEDVNMRDDDEGPPAIGTDVRSSLQLLLQAKPGSISGDLKQLLDAANRRHNLSPSPSPAASSKQNRQPSSSNSSESLL
jgi:serine/threonine protein kinase